MAAQGPDTDDEGFPWYIRAMFVLILLVVLFVVGIDLLEFADAL